MYSGSDLLLRWLLRGFFPSLDGLKDILKPTEMAVINGASHLLGHVVEHGQLRARCELSNEWAAMQSGQLIALTTLGWRIARCLQIDGLVVVHSHNLHDGHGSKRDMALHLTINHGATAVIVAHCKVERK